MISLPPLEARTIQLEIEQFAAQQMIPEGFARDMKWMNEYSMSMRGMLLSLYKHVYVEHGQETIRVPATWWDHFKERWLSRWLEVNYKTYEAKRYFPELQRDTRLGAQVIRFIPCTN